MVSHFQKGKYIFCESNITFTAEKMKKVEKFKEWSFFHFFQFFALLSHFLTSKVISSRIMKYLSQNQDSKMYFEYFLAQKLTSHHAFQVL